MSGKFLPHTGATKNTAMVLGVYDAKCVSISDPKGKSRIKMQIPQVLGTTPSFWADPIIYQQDPPPVGTILIACFLGGNINKPLYFPPFLTWSKQADYSNTANAPGPGTAPHAYEVA